MSHIEINTLIEQHRYIRSRFLKLLAEIESSDHSKEALVWMMPFGEGRAHITWQMMHCAATLDKYLHLRLQNHKEPADPALVEQYGGGSKADKNRIVAPEEIRATLEKTTQPYYEFFHALLPEALDDKPFPDSDRTFREILYLLNWHEANHQGQSQIIWNSFRAR